MDFLQSRWLISCHRLFFCHRLIKTSLLLYGCHWFSPLKAKFLCWIGERNVFNMKYIKSKSGWQMFRFVKNLCFDQGFSILFKSLTNVLWLSLKHLVSVCRVLTLSGIHLISHLPFSIEYCSATHNSAVLCISWYFGRKSLYPHSSKI